MPAPVIRKISSLEKRIVGLQPNSNTGLSTFQLATDQNIHKNLQLGISGLQIGSDFIIGNESQNIKKIFDDNRLTSININHNNKRNWILFDLGKNTSVERCVLNFSGINPDGTTPTAQNLKIQWLFWTANQNPLTDQATVISDNTWTNLPINASNNVAHHLSNNNTWFVETNAGSKYQYVGFRIGGTSEGLPSGYNSGQLHLENLEIYESFDTRDYIVEFNDSVLDLHSWSGMRYKGCKTTGKEINKFTSLQTGAQGIGALQIGNNFIIDEYFTLDPWKGDQTYGKFPNVENKTTALYITSTIVGGTEEEDLYARIKNHSYIKIDQILIINMNDDTVKILESQTEEFEAYHRFITTDFPTKGKFSIRLLDNNVQNALKNEYRVKMNKGWLLKSFEYNADSGPLPGMAKDRVSFLNTTSSHADNVLNTITNPLALYDAVSGSIQSMNAQGAQSQNDTPIIFGYNARLSPQGGVGLYGCEDSNLPCTGKDSASISEEIASLNRVFSFGPLYFSGSVGFDPNGIGDGNQDGSERHISLDQYNQHAGGSLRFRFGVTSRVDDLSPAAGDSFNFSFYPLYTGDNTKFIDNKFTREFVKQENDSTLGVKSFDFPTIDTIEATTQSDGTPNPPFHEWVKDLKINPSVTASLFIGQCIQYLNSHSQDTELHLTLFEGTKDFSGDHDEMSISTFEVDRNADPGYLDFASNLGKLYNSAGPRAKYIKLKNSPQFKPSVQPAKYDRFTYDVLDTTNYMATVEERQNAFVFGPGTPNPHLDPDATFTNLGNIPGPYVSQYDNSPGNSDNFSGSFQYQLSFLDKDHTLIADLDKNSELYDGIGGLGAVLIPEHTHRAVQINLLYYLNKAGLIERTTVKKRVETT